uniref:CopG family transcriptional regulator n=1 Tax=mine drainage metagenome TaxID=410659 RepID=E6QQG5_9ZZZZ
MIRTVISLDDSDKCWLDQQAALLHIPMTEVVRQAVQAMRVARQHNGDDFQALLASTAGIWCHGDGLAWQQSVRDEWTL